VNSLISDVDLRERYLEYWTPYSDTHPREQKEKEKRKNYTGSESHSPHLLRKRSHFGTEYCKAPPPRKGKEQLMGIRSVAGLA
jgi:hypothetical protein